MMRSTVRGRVAGLWLATLALAVPLVVALPAPTASAAPSNDNFAAATSFLVDGASPVFGNSTDATKESGEPNHAGFTGGRSVWWVFTAPANGEVVLTTEGSSFDTLLAVYTGSAVNSLSQVVANDDYSGHSWSRVVAVVSGGTTYHVAVDGFLAASGPITLNLVWYPRPANDDFAAAIGFGPGGPNPLTGWNGAASKEAGEPSHAYVTGGRSVWWAFTAPTNGVMTLTTEGSTFDTVLAVYTGSVVNALTSVVYNNNFGSNPWSRVSWNVAAFTTYMIAVDGAGYPTGFGSITLNVGWAGVPGNDDFVDATGFALTDASPLAGSNAGGSKEPGEPDHAGVSGGASVWWTFTPSSGGTVTISTDGSSFDTVLAVYTGSAVNALTTVTFNDDGPDGPWSQVTFAVVAGTTYHVAVDGAGGATGSIVLGFSWEAAPRMLWPLTPARVIDSRDGTGLPARRLSAGEFVTFTMTGKGGVPGSGVAAVSLNVTVVEAGGDGFLTVYPCGALPNSSNVNYVTGQTVPNAVIAPLSAEGNVCFYTLRSIHLVVDVSAWFPVGADLHPLVPARLVDTRTGQGADAVVVSGTEVYRPPVPDADETDQNARTGSAEAAVVDRYIVQFVDGVIPAEQVVAMEALGLEVQRLYELVFAGALVTGPADAIERLRGEPTVLLVEADVVVQAEPIPADEQAPVEATGTQYGPPWGLDRVDQRNLPLSNTYTYPSTGAGVTAYIADSGIRADHVDFGGRVTAGFTAIADGYGTNDCNGHGTHVAGTVGGSTYGLAKSVTLVPVRVLDCNGSGTVSELISGVDWIIGQHAAGSPAVTNMSFVTQSPNSSLDAAVNRLIADGVTVVIAAGNEPHDACSHSPARVPAGLTVASVDSSDTRASSSAYGTCVDLFAPGVAILSAGISSPTSSATKNGTSMASPHVAGAVAVLLAQRPEWSPAQVANHIISEATTGVVIDAQPGSPNRLLYSSPNRLNVPLKPGEVLELTVVGHGGVPDSGVGAVALNVTAVDALGAGFVTVYPCGPMPTTSNVNYVAGQTVPNAVIAPLSDDGRVCFYTFKSIHLVVDVSAWFPVGSELHPLVPSRLIDTRIGVGLPARPLADQEAVEFSVLGKGGVPGSGVGAVALNVTAVDATGPGFLTVYPCGPLPTTSNVNYVTWQTVPNAVIAPLSSDGTVCFYTFKSIHLVVDVSAWFPD